MSDRSESNSSNIYEENLLNDNVLKLFSKSLDNIPEVNNNFLTVIYLQNNKIKTIPDDFFPSLPNLMWLDLRDNLLIGIPKTIKDHKSLTHLLLQNNKITCLPNEIGTVPLKVLQLSGNQITYPSFEVIKAGTAAILSFLREKFLDELLAESPTNRSDKTNDEFETPLYKKARSYNSVLDGMKPKIRNSLSVQFSEKDNDSDEEQYSKTEGKCPKLPKSRSKVLPFQSSKYVKPLRAYNKFAQEERMKQCFLKDLAVKKQKDLLAAREKILQGRKNMEQLKNWQKNYRNRQTSKTNHNQLLANNFPYDTNPEYMKILTREDIEKDLPDKFRKRLIRKSKPSVPRKNKADVHLAMKIKQLFENLEAIDLNRETMTPRTEQKALLGEIHKISEIKQKLKELSTTNFASVPSE